MPSFRTILVAADFSEPSEEAFRIACTLAEETKTRLFVLHAVEKTRVMEQPIAFNELGAPLPLPSGESAHHEALKERLLEVYAPNRPVDVEFRLHDGAAADEILRLAGEVGADLIVLGTHGRTGLRRLLTGSVAEAVLRRASCPVLTFHVPAERPAGTGAVRVILHPTDFSERAGGALKIARSLARDLGARLYLLFVDPVQPIEAIALGGPLDPQGDLKFLAEMKAKTDGPDLKYPVEIRYEQGDPAQEILRVAREIRCDLIVLGSHGRTGLGRLLMGSVAEAVLRRADCPSLIVKSTRPEPHEAKDESSQQALRIY